MFYIFSGIYRHILYAFLLFCLRSYNPNGVQTGNIVKITYTGSLDDLESLIVIKVQDSDPNEAAKDAQYVGMVVDATMNTLTIQTEDGAVMTFLKEDAVDDLDPCLPRSRLT